MFCRGLIYEREMLEEESHDLRLAPWLWGTAENYFAETAEHIVCS